MRHILLVEDSQAVTDALKILFESQDYKVTVAGSISDAVQVPGRADVMLLDLTLPDGDGLLLIQKMRDAGNLPEHILAMTGHADAATNERCIAAGCTDVFIKPVPTRELLSSVGGLFL